MPEIEDDLKAKNWLSILTYDIAKYIKAGGEVVIEWAADGVIVRLVGVGADTPGVHGRFLSIAVTAPAAPQETPR